MRKKVIHHFRNTGNNLIHCKVKWKEGKTSALIDGYWESMVQGITFRNSKPCKNCLRIYNAN